MKKILIISIMFFLLTGCASQKTKLKKIGYNEEETKIIIENLNKKEINILLEKEYNEITSKLITDKNFNFDNLDRYINYYNAEADIDEIIILVNKDIDKNYPYNKIIIDLIENENYVENNLGRYINYYDEKINYEDLIYIVNNDLDSIPFSDITPSLIKETYFIKDNLSRYIEYYNKTNYPANDIIKNVNSNIDYEFYTNTTPTDTSKGYLMLVNKYNYLDNSYVPNNLVTINPIHGYSNQLEEIAYNAFIKMYDDAKKEGLNLFISSPYRSYNTQYYLYNNYVLENGQVSADTFSARAGHSEHQTGLAIDVSIGTNGIGYFKDTKEFLWMKDNSHKYGYILRYPEGKEYITGYQYEPWHYRYVGVEVATKIYELDITFEEYYAFFIK